jgi:uncharacterized membrane protein
MSPNMKGLAFVGSWLFVCWVFEVRGPAAGWLFMGMAVVAGMMLTNANLEAENRKLKQEVEERESE